MRVEKPLASNSVMGAPPLLPLSTASQVVATSLPTGVTRPSPVMATRRRCCIVRAPTPPEGAQFVPWEMIAEKGCRLGHVERRGLRLRRLAVGHVHAWRRHAAEAIRRSTIPRDEIEARAHRLGRIELRHGQHRSEAIIQCNHAFTV